MGGTCCARCVFPLLADPGSYRRCDWDLTRDLRRRAYWVRTFRAHFPKLLGYWRREAAAQGLDGRETERRACRAQEAFAAFLDGIEQGPAVQPELDLWVICDARQRALWQAGIEDPYRGLKARENRGALRLWTDWLRETDAMQPAERREALAKGIFAGNLFDLGATPAASRFEGADFDFHRTLGELPRRPWHVDDLQAWEQRLARGRAHRAACLFVDNAGADVVLGMLPLARFLLERGTRVLLAANARPALNDITCDELHELLMEVATLDAPIGTALDEGRLQLKSTGNHLPVIDLCALDAEFCQAVRGLGVDLVVMEGMGRALESNYRARLRCDALKVAMIKDPDVASALGGQLYDVVWKFEPWTA